MTAEEDIEKTAKKDSQIRLNLRHTRYKNKGK
jgi:hypothetical protein